MSDAVDDNTLWPACTRATSDLCEGEVNPVRYSLGYRWCLPCGDAKNKYCSIPMHKSNSILVADKRQLKYAGVQTPRDGQE